MGDVLRNPLIKWENLNTIYGLQEIMARHGAALWSSWPSISINKDVSWIKKTNNPTHGPARCKQAYVQMIPSLIAGQEIGTVECPVFTGEDLLNTLNEQIRQLSLPVETLTNEGFGKVMSSHEKARVLLAGIVDKDSHTDFFELWRGISDCLTNLNLKKDQDVIALFNGEGPLLKVVGEPDLFFCVASFPPAGLMGV